jgi:uncharacterized spore protein YtfJ
MDIKDMMSQIADRIERTANVRAVFGEPVGEGPNVVIPVARVSVRGGGGGGKQDMPEQGDTGRKGKGTGMGMGMNIVTAPVGYIRRTADKAEFVPIVDKTRVLAAAGVVAIVGLMVVKTGLKVFGK